MSTLSPIQLPRTSEPRADVPLRMSEDEFVAWANDDASAEWADGKVVLKMPVDEDHDEIQAWLRAIIEEMVQIKKIGKVRGPEFTTRLTLADRVVRRDPDLMFVSNAKVDQLGRTMLKGPPDFAIEIVSPDSEFRDFHEKFAEYEQAGVREYWVVNPMSKQIHQFVRNDATAKFDKRDADAGIVRSIVLDGLWLRIDDVFSPERPRATKVMRELGLID
jgi:Uma2 family endonuclease